MMSNPVSMEFGVLAFFGNDVAEWYAAASAHPGGHVGPGDDPRSYVLPSGVL